MKNNSAINALLAMMGGTGDDGQFFNGRELQDYNDMEEYELIKKKESKLPSNTRRQIVARVERQLRSIKQAEEARDKFINGVTNGRI